MENKFIFVCLWMVVILFLVSCSQTTVVSDDTRKVIIKEGEETVEIRPNPIPSDVVVPPPDPVVSVSTNPVHVRFSIRAEFPSGMVTPDLVSVDGQPLSENMSVAQGNHMFVVEKRGYVPVQQMVLVNDANNDGIFELSLLLKPKDRIVYFDIRDAKTQEVMIPDRVDIVRIPDGQQQTLSDRSYVTPGPKKIVIQKEGYQTLSEDIIISCDDGPYLIQFKMAQ